MAVTLHFLDSEDPESTSAEGHSLEEILILRKNFPLPFCNSVQLPLQQAAPE